MVIDTEGYVTAWEEEVTDIEVAYEGRFILGYIVSITKLSVEEQTVVKHAPESSPSYSALSKPSLPVAILAPKFQLLSFTTLDNTVLICCEIVPESRLCIARDARLGDSLSRAGLLFLLCG